MRPLIIALAVAAGLTLASTPAPCQAEKEKSDIRPSGTVTVDLATRSFGAAPLPFDVAFQIRGKVAPQTGAIFARYGLRAGGTSTDRIQTELGCALWIREPALDSARAAESEFALDFPFRLDADKEYLFEFTLYEPMGAAALPAPPENASCGFYERLKEAGRVSFRTTDRFSIRGSTRTEYTQRFDTDVGFVLSAGAAYTGIASNVHFYPWPINKSADLADFELCESLRRRISLFGGLAVTKLGASKDVDHLMSIGSPMVGIGFRGPFYWRGFAPGPDWAIRPMRMNAGFVWFKQDDPNPLVDETETRYDVFLSLGYDLDVRGILGPFVSLLPK